MFELQDHIKVSSWMNLVPTRQKKTNVSGGSRKIFLKRRYVKNALRFKKLKVIFKIFEGDMKNIYKIKKTFLKF